MKQFAVLSIVVILITATGCATSREKGSDKNEKVIHAYQYYLAIDIDPDNLTPEQEEATRKFDDLAEKEKLELVRFFPWLDSDNLSSRDKVFLSEWLKFLEQLIFAIVL